MMLKKNLFLRMGLVLVPLLSLLLVGSAALATKKAATQKTPDAWIYNNLQQAFQRAGGKKPIIVVMQADWCTPCKQLSYEVLKSPEGKKALQGIVRVKVNFETPEGRKATKRFRVLGLPTTLVLSAKGEESGRVVGYPGKATYLQSLKDLLAGKSDLAALLAKLKKKPNDPKLLVSHAQLLLVRGKIGQAKKILVAQMQAKNSTGARAARLWGRYLLRVKRNGAAGTKHFVWSMSHFQKTRYRTGFLYWAAKGYQLQGKTGAAIALFDALQKQRPKALGPLMMKAGFLLHHKLTPAKAEALVRQALKRKPKMAWLHYMLAQARALQNDKASAKKAIARAIALQPKLAIYRFYASTVQ